MNASLNEKLGTVKWGEFKLGDLFEVVSYKKRKEPVRNPSYCCLLWKLTCVAITR